MSVTPTGTAALMDTLTLATNLQATSADTTGHAKLKEIINPFLGSNLAEQAELGRTSILI